MAISSLKAQPVQFSERINSIDVLRGLVVFGILVINIWSFGLPFDATVNPNLLPSFDSSDKFSFLVSWIGFEGSQRAVFSMLFGAGVILMTQRIESDHRADSARSIYYRRTVYLILFGLIDAYLLLWFGDILFIYGVLGLFLYLLRNTSPRKLVIACGAIIGLMAIMNIALGALLNEVSPYAQTAQSKLEQGIELSQQEANALELVSLQPGSATAAEIEAEISSRSAGYFSAFVPNAKSAFELHIVYGLISLFWDALAMMMLGMALFKWGVFNAKRSKRFYVWVAIIGLSTGISINAWEMIDSMSHDYRSTFSYWSYDIGRLGMAFGFIGIVMTVCKLSVFPRVRKVFASVGRMALTNYIAQSIICNVIFVIFGLYGQLQFHQLYYVAIGVWTLQLVYSPWWLARFRYGPLEWVWRSLTYRQLLPLKSS